MADENREFKEVAQLFPDGKGRITLGKYAKGISSFKVNVDKEGRILLEPFVEIPAHERWLFLNREAYSRVKRGLEDSSKKKTRSLGSFSKYTKGEGDDEE